MSVLGNLFTGKDNETHDLGRVLWALGCFVFLVLAVISVIRNPACWDGVTFATAFGVMLGAGAGSLALKAKTEPEAKP